MPPKPLSAKYFDGWYADQAATPTVAEIMNRYLGFPPGTQAGVVAAAAVPELVGQLHLGPSGTLLDLGCGRGAYGLLVAKQAGTPLIGVDFSAQALAAARTASAGRPSPTWRSGTVRPGWRASADCGKKPSRSTLATTPRCHPCMTKA